MCGIIYCNHMAHTYEVPHLSNVKEQDWFHIGWNAVLEYVHRPLEREMSNYDTDERKWRNDMNARNRHSLWEEEETNCWETPIK